MQTIEPLGPDAEVLGGAINGFIDAINREKIWPHLKKLKMTEIDPNAWYPKQMYIDLWNSLLSSPDSAMFNLVDIGMTIANTAWPPEADGQPFDDLVLAWGDAFDVVNRGKDRGYIKTEKRAPNQYIVKCRTPDPDHLHYGIAYGFCKRFLPHGTDFTVEYDESTSRRDNGSKETVILITLD